jgi:hypothetical protein
MWTRRTENHLRPDVKYSSHAEPIFMKLRVTRYVVVDMPCTELYLNGTRIVESTYKINFTPLFKVQFPLNRILSNSELLNGIRGEIFCTGVHPNRSRRTESRVEIQ